MVTVDLSFPRISYCRVWINYMYGRSSPRAFSWIFFAQWYFSATDIYHLAVFRFFFTSFFFLFVSPYCCSTKVKYAAFLWNVTSDYTQMSFIYANQYSECVNANFSRGNDSTCDTYFKKSSFIWIIHSLYYLNRLLYNI